MKKKTIIISLVGIVIIGVILFFTLFKGNGSNGMVYFKEKVDRGDIVALVDTTGEVNPVTIVDVGSQVSGEISEIFVDFNSRVEKGQVIAKLNPELFQTQVNQRQANYLSAKANLEKAEVSLQIAKKQMDRTLELFDKDLVSTEEKENAEADYFNAKASLQQAEASLEQSKQSLESSKVDLSHTIIQSPIDGVVINRNYNVGQTVAASFQAPVLFQIANDLTKMQVECEVDEADIGKVKEGQKVTFTVDAFPDEEFIGEVEQVRYSAVVESNVVTYPTIVNVENPELKLRPGMTATVSIIVGEAKNALRIPNSALRYSPPQETMMEVFAEMRAKSKAEGERTPQKKVGSSEPGSQRMMLGSAQNRRRDVASVWVQDESGKLKVMFIRTGVTDNVYTEIKSSNLKEDQEVIVDEGQASEERRGGPPMMRMLR
ncbi:MAG: efflux RND transporter periplasmic adaptor subunit [Candidatus Aminicenantes bacterium]|nr:efflux RND transporter periplasmic adaptor subunit [Candidatus Aminicenantes bacterium]